MPIGLPERYPSTCALPFNRESLEDEFQLATPDQEPAEKGVWLLLYKQKVLTISGENGPELPTDPSMPKDADSPYLYIGSWQGRPCRMIFLNEFNADSTDLTAHSLHAQNPQIPLSIISLAGVGLMIQHWEESSRFCGYCGKELIRLEKEWGKRCPNCEQHHFPRIHPCVIGLIVRGDEILLVRKPEWASGRFGLVAGFVEFGESLEEAMAREIAEETGIEVDNLRYIGSQCWPFPSQIMNGFVADYVAGEFKLQEEELEEAGWYKLTELPTLPPRRSIARYLIDKAEEFLHR
ncbi:NAD(+) diphosphatase [Malonomonas rubra]|uniref:NAD(+) diphosphatase n=1 Tax=Malonomonas rubra TaxID=57040 RepID=UPI0026F0FE56|nr:NAD(+) diphosphatase [Malonomonas rubra]